MGRLLVARALEVLGRDLLRQRRELVADHVEEHAQVARRDAGGHLQRAAVVVALGPGVDLVGEAALLAHRLEQRRGHAAAEQLAEQLVDRVRGVGARRHRPAERDRGLLVVVVDVPVAADVARELALGGHAGGHVAEAALDLLGEARVVDVAGGRDDHVRRGIVGAEVAEEVVARDALDEARAAEDRPPERLLREGLQVELVLRDRLGVVGGVTELLQDHLPLAVDLLGGEGRAADHVGEHVERDRHVLGEQHRVVGGVVLGGVGVHRRAHPLDLERDAPRVAGLGALERHVLEEMRDAVQVRGLVARADAHERADRRGAEAGQPHRRDRQPVGQHAGAQVHRRRAGRGAGARLGAADRHDRAFFHAS